MRNRDSSCEVIDEIAVNRALEGDLTVTLTEPELQHVWERLETDEYSAEEIAETLGITRRTVTRWRAAGNVMQGRTGRSAVWPEPRPDQQTRRALGAQIFHLERQISEAKIRLGAIDKHRQYGPMPGSLPTSMSVIRRWAQQRGLRVLSTGRVSNSIVNSTFALSKGPK